MQHLLVLPVLVILTFFVVWIETALLVVIGLALSNAPTRKRFERLSGPTNDNELKSFPSGHTAVSFGVIAYALFAPYTSRLRAGYVTVLLFSLAATIMERQRAA